MAVMTAPGFEDPLRLRELLARAASFSCDHSLQSTVVGIAGPEGSELFPELVDYIEAGLRVEDTVLRLTRDRAILFLADTDAERAHRITRRLLDEFQDRFPTVRGPEVAAGYFEVKPGTRELTVKEVLPSIFGAGATRA